VFRTLERASLLMLAFPAISVCRSVSSPSIGVLGFACCVAIVTGVLFGVAPALIGAKGSASRCLAQRDTDDDGWGFAAATRLVCCRRRCRLCFWWAQVSFRKAWAGCSIRILKLETKNRYIVHINAQAAGYKMSR